MGLAAWEWAGILSRWLHVVTAIAWIGTSFYFVHLDASLRKQEEELENSPGETWQIHSGGFYHLTKYHAPPGGMPAHLTWFKWEAYGTWLSGLFLLVILYYRGADILLLPNSESILSPVAAVWISMAALAGGWIGYDLLCRSAIGRQERMLGAALLLYFTLAAYLVSLVFSARGTLMQMGAIIGTVMAANVLWVIAPNQRRQVQMVIKGEKLNLLLGEAAKQRSMHNNYLTLPVVFLMLSNHYPTIMTSPLHWMVVPILLVVGFSVRFFFNSRHARKSSPWWALALGAVGILVMVALSVAARREGRETSRFVSPPPDLNASAEKIITARCSVCHAEVPSWKGIMAPPRDLKLDSPEQIHRHAQAIYEYAGLTDAMPPGNVTGITPEERTILSQWALQLRSSQASTKRNSVDHKSEIPGAR